MTTDYPTPNDKKQYTPEEDAFLRREYGKSSTEEIAKALGRNPKGVSHRAMRLNLSYFGIPDDIPEGHKFCIGCKTVFPLDGFGVNGKSKDGKSPYCKVCTRKKNSERWLKQKEKKIMGSAIEEEKKVQAIIAELNNQNFTCGVCGKEKLGKDFGFDRRRLTLEPRCKACKQENNLKNKVKRIKNGSDW